MGGGEPIVGGDTPEGGYDFTGVLAAQFQLPFGVAVDVSGLVYVTDAATRHVLKFNPGDIPLLMWGTEGTGDGEFLMPTGIAPGSAGDIYVGDYLGGRTQVFDRTDGAYRRTLAGSATGGPAGNIERPYGIAYTPGFFDTSRLWITDFTGDRVHMHTPTQGWTSWGGTGQGPGQFRRPCAIACSRDGGMVYVQFSSTGRFAKQWGSEGHGPGKFYFPEGIAVTETGHVLVADTQNHRIQRFTAKGVYISKFGRHGGPNDAFGFDQPHGIAVSDSGVTYVCDYGNGMVKKYQRTQ